MRTAVMNQASNLEVEVKFLAPDLLAIRERLLAAGATLTHPRQLERNLRFDTPGEALRQRGQLLRLRQDSVARLTFKGAFAAQASSEAKVREELEVTVSDFERMGAILSRLGLAPLQVYEKYRETFVLQEVEVVLDELPFGNFVELEGDEQDLRRAAAALGLSWATRILDNYLSLMARVKAHYELPFDDLTFTNFEGRAINLAAVLASAD
jgi:adenylate cyclase, class 2